MVARSMDSGRRIDGRNWKDTGEKEGQNGIDHDFLSSTAAPGTKGGGRLAYRVPKEERAIAASLPCPRNAHWSTGRPPTVATPDVERSGTTALGEDDLGPTLLQIHTRSYEERLVFKHIPDTDRVAMGALLSLPLLAVPSVGSVRLPSRTYSCATDKADMVYSS